MNRKTWTIFLLGLAAMMLLAQYALTQGCTPGYSNGSITVGDLQSQCVEQYPAPQTRTDVGIGEEVVVSISSWSGTATYTDQYCNQTIVEDGPGIITWSVSGQGSVYPTSSGDGQTSTYLTIDLADADNVVTVFANCTDALGVAPPVQKQKAFNAKIPTGINPISYSDQPPFQAGTDLIGCRTIFMVQVQPQNVNFTQTSVRENMANDYTWTWPNGQNDKIAGGAGNATNPKDIKIGQVTFPNIYPDAVGTYGAAYTVGYIKDKNTGQFVDFDKPNPTIPLEYKDKNGNWKNFDNTGTRPREWTGASKAGRCGVVAAGTLWGGNQGPFIKQN